MVGALPLAAVDVGGAVVVFQVLLRAVLSPDEALLVLAAAQVELGLDRRAAATAQRVRDAYPGLDAGEWLDRNPYQDAATVERWKQDLKTLDLVSA